MASYLGDAHLYCKFSIWAHWQ